MLMDRRRQDRARRLEAFRQKGKILPLNRQRAEALRPDPLSTPRVRPDDTLKLKAPFSEKRKKWADRFLLGIEILAVVGLVVIFLNGWNMLSELNAQVSSLFEAQPTPSPTPILQAVVLPSGHTPPSETGGARPNDAEIPQHLRPQLQSYNAAIVVPTPGPQHALGIFIEAISLNAPIVQGDGWEDLKRGVGQHIGTANPGELGNLVLSGHNDVFGEVFRHLDDLEVGDEIHIRSEQRTFTYVVTNSMLVEPTFVEVMAPTEDATLTLISCFPYLVDKQRIIIQASLQSD